MDTRKYKPALDSTLPGESSTPLERIQNHSLPDYVIQLIDDYDDIVGDRNRFLWKWAHHLFPEFTLSSVPTEQVGELRDAKLIGLMFVSILDDTAETHNDHATFEEAAKIPFEHQSPNHHRNGVDREVLTFASDIWDQFAPTVQEGSRAAEYEDIFRFDMKQVLNAIDYSYLANQNIEFTTASQLQTYDAHNMMLFAFTDIDLIHSPTFDQSELTALRRVIERTQRMVRIGNWITTWERELHEGDFTSGVVAYAREEGIVSADDLRAARDGAGSKDVETLIDTIQNHAVEEVFLRRWQEELAASRKFEDEFGSVDIGAFLDGIETVMDYHLASRGLK